MTIYVLVSSYDGEYSVDDSYRSKEAAKNGLRKYVTDFLNSPLNLEYYSEERRKELLKQLDEDSMFWSNNETEDPFTVRVEESELHD